MIDIDKKYTFKGAEGTVLSVDRKHKNFPVVWMSDKGEVLFFTSAGHYLSNPNRLIEVKPTYWVNVYPPARHFTREDADRAARRYRIACVEVKEGDGI